MTALEADRWRPESQADRIARHRHELAELTGTDDDVLLHRIVQEAVDIAGPEPHPTEHRGGIPWFDPRVHIRGWRRRLHRRHQAQSRSLVGNEVLQHCRCGAISSDLHTTWVRP